MRYDTYHRSVGPLKNYLKSALSEYSCKRINSLNES